jgi:hypothetical protein
LFDLQELVGKPPPSKPTDGEPVGTGQRQPVRSYLPILALILPSLFPPA